ncbi:MAG: hypothetical protein MHM6MM_007616 [Cercozoa sp. M6MM]
MCQSCWSWSRFNLKLKEAALRKVKVLTVARQAALQKRLDFAQLRERLDCTSERQVELLVLAALEHDLLSGKIDHRNNCFWVSESRLAWQDEEGDVASIRRRLQAWHKTGTAALAMLDTQMALADAQQA